jgi:protein phosphatase 1 regulatory subunit 10
VQNVRELDRGEGAALHAHLFEELLDWSEPQRKRSLFAIVTPHWHRISISLAIDIPEDIEAYPKGEGSQERGAQEQRELTALGASYLVQPIPESPTDLPPALILSQERIDENIVHMLAGAEIESLSWRPAMTTAPLAGASVSELVGQLAEGADLALPDALPAPTFDPAVLAQFASSIPQEQLQQLAQMFATQQQQPQSQGDQQSWDSQAPAFSADASGAPHDRWPPASEESRWGGSGRGRGRGRPVDGVRQFKSRIPCSFYAQGRQAHIPTPSPLLFDKKTDGNPVKTDASTESSAASVTIKVLARTVSRV